MFICDMNISHMINLGFVFTGECLTDVFLELLLLTRSRSLFKSASKLDADINFYLFSTSRQPNEDDKLPPS